MKITCQWQENMKFVAKDSKNQIEMDAKKPFGNESAMTPKELLVAGLCGCTAMDVVGLLKKHKQTMDSFEIQADVTESDKGHPKVFDTITLNFQFKGNIDTTILLDSVKLSQTKFCGVSAMLSKAVKIQYKVSLNSEAIGEGKADFQF